MTKRRVVILGLDGLDPTLLSQWMDAGGLPNFARLRAEGTFSPLRTTNPPETACAWAAFSTGQNPGKTGIFDFVIRDPHTYSPLPGLVALARGKPGEPPRFRNARQGEPVWKILGDHGLQATVLNLPVTWPPDPSTAICFPAWARPTSPAKLAIPGDLDGHSLLIPRLAS
jgi:predicted AlkP superfamily phosphohydrolase/phosphomutase